MPLCRYFQQGNCRYGNRCRYEHSYANYAYAGGGGGGGGGFVGGYRGGGSSGGYGGGYSYSGYGSGGGGASSGGGNDRGGVSILRLKSGAQYPQSSNSLFGQNASVNRPHMEVAQPLFGQTAPPPKPIMRPNTKETVQLLLNEITVCEQGKQWPLSCFCPVKELGNFPGIEDQSPEELRWYMYRALQEGKLEECKLQTAQLYDYAKLCRQQLMNPNAEILAILEKISRFERIDTSPSPFMNLRGSFGGLSAAGGTSILAATPSAASSFSFKLDNKPTQPAAPSFPAFGAPVQTGLFSNPAYAGRTSSIFGGTSQMPPAAQPASSPVPAGVSTPKVGLFSSTAAPGSIDDCVIYTPMQELSEEMVNAYKCSTFTMGSVPTKPPPKELCG